MSETSSEAIAFDKLFASIDAMDTERFLGFLSPDVEFRFGSAPAVSGHEGVRAAVDGFFASIAGLRHELHRVVANGATAIVEGDSTYERHSGSEITLPFCNVFEIDNGRIAVYRIYIDIAPLYLE